MLDVEQKISNLKYREDHFLGSSDSHTQDLVPLESGPFHEEVDLGLGTDGGDDGAAEAPDDVAGEESDAAGRRVNQDREGLLPLLGGQAAELDQAVPGRQALRQEAGTLLEAKEN